MKYCFRSARNRDSCKDSDNPVHETLQAINPFQYCLQHLPDFCKSRRYPEKNHLVRVNIKNNILNLGFRGPLKVIFSYLLLKAGSTTNWEQVAPGHFVQLNLDCPVIETSQYFWVSCAPQRKKSIPGISHDQLVPLLLWTCVTLWSHGSTELFRLEKISETIETNFWLVTTLSSRPEN